MSIIRAARHAQYYVLPTATIEDDRLSWEARGMLVYLLQKPDHWNADVNHLIGRTRGCLGKAAGRDKVYSILKELRMAGYVYSTFRRVGGEFKGVDYEVSEVPDLRAAAAYVASLEQKDAPFTDLPETVKEAPPLTDLPDTVPPLTANPGALDKTERASKLEKAVKPITDPQQAKPVADQPHGDAPALPPDYPSEFPSNPASSIYSAWLAYAVAFRERYKLWPVYNATVAGMMGKAVARIQDATPAAAIHYVKHESATALVDKLHPISIFLKNCESYAGKAQLADKSKKRADRTAAALKEAEQASASAPPPAANTKSTPTPASTGIAALSALKTRVGVRK